MSPDGARRVADRRLRIDSRVWTSTDAAIVGPESPPGYGPEALRTNHKSVPSGRLDRSRNQSRPIANSHYFTHARTRPRVSLALFPQGPAKNRPPAITRMIPSSHCEDHPMLHSHNPRRGSHNSPASLAITRRNLERLKPVRRLTEYRILNTEYFPPAAPPPRNLDA